MLFLLLVACIPSEVTTLREAVHDYEWFHSAYNTIDGKVRQIEAQAQLVATEQDAAEVRRLKMELSGMQQSCRQLVADYNGNSDKVHIGVFQGGSLPDHLALDLCEVK